MSPRDFAVNFLTISMMPCAKHPSLLQANDSTVWLQARGGASEVQEVEQVEEVACVEA